MNSQLEIDGIGQQKMTLESWKVATNIKTLKSDGFTVEEFPWCCWSENHLYINSVHDFMENYDDGFGYGQTEKEAITHYCEKFCVKTPFWW